jgi:hypothetical protein
MVGENRCIPYCYWIIGKFSEIGFTKLLLYMKRLKKSDAGHAEVWM